MKNLPPGIDRALAPRRSGAYASPAGNEDIMAVETMPVADAGRIAFDSNVPWIGGAQPEGSCLSGYLDRCDEAKDVLEVAKWLLEVNDDFVVVTFEEVKGRRLVLLPLEGRVRDKDRPEVIGWPLRSSSALLYTAFAAAFAVAQREWAAREVEVSHPTQVPGQPPWPRETIDALVAAVDQAHSGDFRTLHHVHWFEGCRPEQRAVNAANRRLKSGKGSFHLAGFAPTVGEVDLPAAIAGLGARMFHIDGVSYGSLSPGQENGRAAREALLNQPEH